MLIGVMAAHGFCAIIPAVAQTEENARTVRAQFSPEDFARFAPRTALDMVQQIPGFVIREGASDRGFGQADTNVLINGRRISGKSNGPIDA
ncbi:MAG: TonB-dependent receptor plug domain-containing protein, partial [Pseudomonadota bacterium]